MPLRRGWGACQVLRRAKQHTLIVALDHWSLDRPTLESVTRRELVLDHHSWPGNPYLLNVVDELPSAFVLLGSALPIVPDVAAVGSYGMWASLPLQCELQLRWNALPEAARVAFRDKRRWPEPVTLPISSKAPPFTRGITSLSIAFGAPGYPKALHINDPSRFDFSVLDALPALLQLDITGVAPDLVEWLKTRPMIEALTWRGALPRHLDLSLTGLRSCDLEAEGEHTVKLPADLGALTLRLGESSRWRVDAELDGALLDLTLRTWRGEGVSEVAGVGRARGLTLSGFDEVDARLAAERYDPTSLVFRGQPGIVRHSASLAKFSSLESIEFWSCVELGAEEIPLLSSWPQLRRLWVVGALVGESAALKARWGRDRRVSVRTPVTAEWARRNTGHRMGRWHDELKSCRARAAFASAFRKLDGAGAAGPKARAAVLSFVREINKVHDDCGGVSALEASDVEDAWGSLVRRITPSLEAEVTASWLRDTRKGW